MEKQIIYILTYSWCWPMQSDGYEDKAFSTKEKAHKAFIEKIAESRSNDWIFDANYDEGRKEDLDPERMSYYAAIENQGDYIDIHVKKMALN